MPYASIIKQGDCETDILNSILCYTAAGTSAKTATCKGYKLLAKSYINIFFENANSYNGKITLNIENTGAKDVYINGSVSSDGNKTLPAGGYIAYYDGTNYHLRTDGKIPASISGDAATVGGHTVEKDVPNDAEFLTAAYKTKLDNMTVKTVAEIGTAVSDAFNEVFDDGE